MKTVGDLRQFITDNGGTFTIGPLKFEYYDGGDMDVKLYDDLCLWLSKNEKDETVIEETSEWSISFDYNKESIRIAKSESDKEQKEINTTILELKTENETLKKNENNALLALGKVEAYEKILKELFDEKIIKGLIN